MEAIKNAIGLGTTTAPQEGREPVSGVTGSGVAGEPYDQGNVDDSTLGGKAPQHTDTITDSTTNPSTTSSTGPYTIGSGLGSNSKDTTTGLHSSDAVTPNVASATSASGPAVDPTSSNTTSTSGPHSSNLANKADPRIDSDNDRTTGVGSSNLTSGSTNSGPHDSNAANKVDPRVDSDNDRNTASGAGGIGSSSWMGTALPHREGNNTSVSGSTPTDAIGTSSAAGTSTTGLASDPMHAHQDVPGESVGSSVTSASKPSHSLTASRGSIAPEKPDYTNAPLKPAEKGGEHGVNPSAIPTAGGKKIGEDAYTERKSIQVDSLDSTTSPLPTTTSTNTARNVGTAEATGTSSTVGHEQDKEKENVTSGSSGSEHKEKKGLVEKIKEKVHAHKH